MRDVLQTLSSGFALSLNDIHIFSILLSRAAQLFSIAQTFQVLEDDIGKMHAWMVVSLNRRKF
jgi:hypothetical protein